MPFKIITGDFLKQPAEIMVIPTAKKLHTPITGVSRRVYKAAGYNKMMKARRDFGELKFGDIAVTSGFDLNVHNIIYACVPIMPIKISKEDYREAHRKSIIRALRWAEQNGMKSISIPLFVTGVFREFAENTAVLTIKYYLRSNESCLNVYLVIPPSAEPVYEEQTNQIGQSERTEREKTVTVNYIDCYSEYDRRFEEKFRESKMPRDEFCRKYIYTI